VPYTPFLFNSAFNQRASKKLKDKERFLKVNKMVNAGLKTMSYTTCDTVTVGSRPARSISELL